MKINLTINDSEKDRIIELHNLIKESLNSKLNKKRINEQTTPQLKGVELLNAAKANQKCKLPFGGKLQNAPGKPTVLFKIADYDSANGYFVKGDSLYIKDNFTFDVVRNNKLISENKPWKCQALFEVGPDPNSGDIEKEIAAKWIKREDLKNVSNTELASSYVQHPKYKNLYRLKGLGTDKMCGYDENQQAFIDSWTKANPDAKSKLDVSTYKYNPTAADFATGQWKKNNYFIADGSESFFPADENGVRGLKIYYNWAKISQEPTRENCRAAIKDYATMFALRNSKPSTAQDIATKKAFVQLCKDQPNMKFGGPLSKIDDYLKLMSGGEGGPTRTGEDAKWLLR